MVVDCRSFPFGGLRSNLLENQMPLAVTNSWIPNAIAVSIANRSWHSHIIWKPERDVHIDEIGLTGDNLYTYACNEFMARNRQQDKT